MHVQLYNVFAVTTLYLTNHVPAKTLTLGVRWPNVIVYIGNWLQCNVGPVLI